MSIAYGSAIPWNRMHEGLKHLESMEFMLEILIP